MTKQTTRRTLLRHIAAGSAVTTVGSAPVSSQTGERAPQQPVSDETDGPARLLYSCDITTEDDPTPDVNDRFQLRRVEGTFGPTKTDCFEAETLIYRYLFTRIERSGPRGRQGIAWSTRERLPEETYRIATIFVCDEAPSGYCAVEPFYGIAVRRVDQ
ncbi:hypothetical protein [Haladaptatus sp. NG-WS-4]